MLVLKYNATVILSGNFIFSYYALRVAGSSATRRICFPDISTLTTSLLQEQALQKLREIAVVSFKQLLDETRRIRRIMSQNAALNHSTQHHLNTNNNTHSGSPVLADHNHQGSASKQTITQHINLEGRQS